MSADGCVVPLPGGGTCGWERDGRHLECAAHRRRMRMHGDYRAHMPVARKPSRKPGDVAARLDLRAAIELEQKGYGVSLIRQRRRSTAALA